MMLTANEDYPSKNLHTTFSLFNLKDEKEREVYGFLQEFQKMTLNEKILHPFNALAHLDQLYLSFISRRGRQLAKDLIFNQQLSKKIFDYLLQLTRSYLKQNGAIINEEKIYRNWHLLTSLSLPVISKAIPFKEEIVEKQINNFLESPF
ncbi:MULTISPECIES: hypothetical protein [Lactobacillus]|uniref:Uncharacterized protein n=1 Tax=Lactobacillus xujianguonis TaxID=2495899 RepID=A0A437SUR2_9LACO|nr:MULTISPECIES: hypothetical protein [Lactobacillus]RVU70570.1 hypothetical protein EJK17_06675 [Lactobacillus xujianguonis]